MARVAVAGSLAQRHGRGGHAWVFLNYLLGLRELGHEVLFVDRLAPEMLDAAGGEIARSPQARWLRAVMAAHGLAGSWLLLEGSERDAPQRAEALERLRRTDLLLNVNGFLRDAELLAAPEVRAFVDIDPAIQHMWQALGLAEVFAGHDLHFTVGENVGRPACEVPTCGVEWIPTRPPVVLGEWPAAVVRGRGFTTVASWRGPYGPIEYEGRSYGLRVHELRPLAGLAAEVQAELAIALDIDADDDADAGRLREGGWRLLDPVAVAGDTGSYRAFIQTSEAELSIAKNVYVRSRCGWFSDRSACYLASGRPVVAQDTGFSENLPTGRGLLAFGSAQEAAAAIEEVSRDWARHSRAAREIAAERFDATRVLKEVLGAAGH